MAYAESLVAAGVLPGVIGIISPYNGQVSKVCPCLMPIEPSDGKAVLAAADFNPHQCACHASNCVRCYPRQVSEVVVTPPHLPDVAWDRWRC